MRGIAGPLTKLIIFMVITVLATSLLALTIANIDLRSASDYSARFSDVTSLNVGDDVRISGVRVGQVESLDIGDRNRAVVGFSLDQGRRLPADVRAVIKYRNMVGQRYVALERGNTATREQLPEGAEIPLDRTTPALDLTDLFNGFKPLFQALSPNDVNELSGEIVQVLQGEGGTVESLLQHTGSLTTTLAGRDKVIGEVIGNLNTVLNTVNGKGDALANLVSTLRQLVSGLAGDRAAIGDAISGIGALTESTAGLFEQARPPLKDSIAGLKDVAGTLAQNQSDVDSFLTNLPVKFTEIGRTASYGSWMNFFLCRATLEATPPRGVLTHTARCES